MTDAIHFVMPTSPRHGKHSAVEQELVGIGLYTPAEAGRLLGINPGRILRWLRGHRVGTRSYERLWAPQVDLGEDGIFLGFRDLQEVRVASAFIEKGLSPQAVRLAIQEARKITGDERPLSTTKFRTDGRKVFLQFTENGEAKLIDLFSRQYTFRSLIERSLLNVDYDEAGVPTRWWPFGKTASVVLDPARSFGQPIEAETSVPASTLAAAAKAEGSVERAAKAWSVPIRAVRRAVEFEGRMAARQSA